MNPALLYVSAVGVLCGVAGALLFSWGITAVLVMLCFGCVGLFACLYIRRPVLFLAVICCSACALGVMRTEAFHRTESSLSLGAYAGATHQIVGIVAADPDVRDTKERLTIAVSQVDGVSQRGTLIASTLHTGAISYGDMITVSGTLSLPLTFTTDTGRVFDYPGYLRASGVSVLMERARVLHVSPGSFSVA